MKTNPAQIDRYSLIRHYLQVFILYVFFSTLCGMLLLNHGSLSRLTKNPPSNVVSRARPSEHHHPPGGNAHGVRPSPADGRKLPSVKPWNSLSIFTTDKKKGQRMIHAMAPFERGCFFHRVTETPCFCASFSILNVENDYIVRVFSEPNPSWMTPRNKLRAAAHSQSVVKANCCSCFIFFSLREGHVQFILC